jgi:hypothetical protein
MSGKVAEPPSSQQAPAAEGPPLSAPTSPVTSEDLTPSLDDRIKVGLLLPLSGSSAKLGEALLHGAEMALFETADDRLQLLVKDTGGTPDGARVAAEAAIAEGARLILGPLFGPQVAAAGPVARAAAVPMVSFSTDLGVSGSGVWVMGILPKIQVERVVGASGLVAMYIVGAFAAAGAQWLAAPMGLTPMIGASGAVSAVIGAYSLSFGRAKAVTRSPRVNRWLNALWLLAAWIVLQLMTGYIAGQEGTMLATPAHIGGFVAGLLLQRPLLLLRYRNA